MSRLPAALVPLASAVVPCLTRHLALETDDLDRARVHVGGVFAPHRLDFATADNRALSVWHARAHLGSISFNLLRYGGEVLVGAPALEDFYLVQLMLAGSCAIETCGRHVMLSPGTLFVTDPAHAYRKRWSVDGCQLILRIERALIERMITEEYGHAVALHFIAEPFAIDGRARSLLRFLDSAVRDLGDEAPVYGVPRVRQYIERGLIALLLETLPHSLSDRFAAAGNAVPAPGIVRRAETYIEAHAAEPLGLDDIACAAGTSPRALQAGFRRFRETTPMAYLKAVRLDRARRDLAHENGSVTEVALTNGFAHLGRFARDYKIRFDETPSRTRRRRYD